MKIAIWSAGARPGHYGTGVTKHFVRMAKGLSELGGNIVSLLLDRADYLEDRAIRGESPLRELPAHPLPFNRRWMEAMWWGVGLPTVDRWIGNQDWLYCPRELYIPTAKIPAAITVHDLYPLEELDRSGARNLTSKIRWRHALGLALRKARLIVAVSEFTKSRILHFFRIDPDKIVVIPNGVDDEFFDLYSGGFDSKLACGRPYFLSVGGLTYKKGADWQLRFAAELQRRAPEYRLLVTGPVEPAYDDIVRASKNITILKRGFPNETMHRLMAGASSLVILSRYEGFGIPALEAMAAGVPVVAATTSSLPEVVGNSALLVDPESAEIGVSRLLDLLGSEVSRSSLIERGRLRALGFRWSYSVNQLHAALESNS